MASYEDLAGLAEDETLRDRLSVAVIIKAEAVRADGAATTEAKAWARRAYFAPVDEVARMIWALLAANKDQTVAAIEGVDDSVMQTQVDNIVDQFIA